jgi:transposase-like protein
MSRPTRKPYAATEKVAILRRHLVEQVPVSDLCEQYQLQPTVFYRWQNSSLRMAPRLSLRGAKIRPRSRKRSPRSKIN